MMAGLMDWMAPPSIASGILQSVSNPLVYLNPEVMVGNFDVIKALTGWRVLSEVEVAATALFMYDYVLTLGMEINLVWTAKWNWIKLLYLAQRYTPFIDAGFITIYRHVGTDFAKSHCQRMTMTTGVLTIVGTIGSEILLTIRVWAIWNRGLKFGIALLVGFIGVWIPACTAAYLYTHSIIYPENPPYTGFRGCFIMHDKPLVVWCWLGLLVWDLLCLILVTIPAFYTYRSGISSSTRLTYVVYRDGTVYYALLFVMSVVNIVFSYRLPASSRVVTLSLTRCLHSVLASRVLLQLREQIQAEDSDTFAMEGEMSLNMMGTTHIFDEDVFTTVRGYGGASGVDAETGGRRGAGVGAGGSGSGSGSEGPLGDGLVGFSDRRKRTRSSKRHSSTPTMASGVE